mgnify:CR=1 FL=1
MTSIKLPVNADLNQVAELKEQLIIALQTQEALEFDAAHVENMSTPLLQLLLVVQSAAQKNHLPLFFKKPSQSFMGVIKNFGCLDYFEGSLK